MEQKTYVADGRPARVWCACVGARMAVGDLLLSRPNVCVWLARWAPAPPSIGAWCEWMAVIWMQRFECEQLGAKQVVHLLHLWRARYANGFGESSLGSANSAGVFSEQPLLSWRADE